MHDKSLHPIGVDGIKVALMQPAFLPWCGYFELLEAVDIFVFLDDFQVSRQSWSQRNKLFLSVGKVGLVSLPLSRKPHNGTFLQIRPVIDEHWKKKFISAFLAGYSKTLYVDTVLEILKTWLHKEYTTLADLLISFICAAAKYIGIFEDSENPCKKLLRSSDIDYDRTLSRSRKVQSLLSAIGSTQYYSPMGSFQYMYEDKVFPLQDCLTFFQFHEPVAYSQFGVSHFVPYLSIVDAMCNLAPQEIQNVIKGTKHWLSWDKAVRHFEQS